MVRTSEHARIELPTPGDPVRRGLMKALRPGLEMVLKFGDLNRIHDAAISRGGSDPYAALL